MSGDSLGSYNLYILQTFTQFFQREVLFFNKIFEAELVFFFEVLFLESHSLLTETACCLVCYSSFTSHSNKSPLLPLPPFLTLFPPLHPPFCLQQQLCLPHYPCPINLLASTSISYLKSTNNLSTTTFELSPRTSPSCPSLPSQEYPLPA